MTQGAQKFIIGAAVLAIGLLILPLVMTIPFWAQFGLALLVVGWIALSGDEVAAPPDEILVHPQVSYMDVANDPLGLGGKIQIPSITDVNWEDLRYMEYKPYHFFQLPIYAMGEVKVVNLIVDARANYKKFRHSRLVGFYVGQLAFSQMKRMVPREPVANVDKLLNSLEQFGLERKKALSVLSGENDED